MARVQKPVGQLLRNTTPGRFQVQLQYYDRAPRAYRPIPGHALQVDVTTPAEVRRLFAEIEQLVTGGGWRDEHHAGDPGDPGGAAGVRDVAASAPVDEE